MAGFLSALGRGLAAFGGFGGSPYVAARYDLPESQGWHAQRTHEESAFEYGNDTIVGRAEDSDRNNSWINGGIDRKVESIIGTGLKLYPTVFYAALGKDYNWGAYFGEGVLSRYRLWAEDPINRCDATMRVSLGSLERLGFLNFVRSGEVLAEIRQDDRGSSNPINILLIDPARIASPMGISASDNKIKNGIEYAGSVPIAAWIRPFHPSDSRTDKGINEPIRVEFRTSTGMPKLILISNTRYVEQVRGVSGFAGSLTVAKVIDSYEKDVANRARMENEVGAFFKSNAPANEVSELISPGASQGSQSSYSKYLDWRKLNPMKAVGNLFFRRLYLNEDVVFTPPQTPGNGYPTLLKSMMAKMAAQMGLSAPELSMDYTGINKSTARSMDNRSYKTVVQEREFWSRRWNTAIYMAWMEHEIAQGTIKIPGGPANFYKNISALTNSTWFGPGKGSVDPVQEETARNLKEASHRGSPIQHMLEDGVYADEIWNQIKYTRDKLSQLGLSMPNYNVKAKGDDSQDGGGAGDSGGDPADGDKDGIPNEADKKKSKPKKGGSA